MFDLMLGKYRSNPVKMDTEGGGGEGGAKETPY